MNTLWSFKRKMVDIPMIALLAVTLSACVNSDSGNTSAESTSGVNDTAVSEQSTPESENSIDVTEAADEGVPNTEPSDNGDVSLDENGMINVTITVGNEVFAAKFYDNESARAIVSEMPFTLEMEDYASQEKVTDLDFALPSASTEAPATINSGDIYLWAGNSLVLFYTTFSNSYSYTRLGYITDVAGLAEALGSGNIEVSFTINN